MITASAPAKAILMGEHSVVYHRPAIAIPLPQVRATAEVKAGTRGDGLWLYAPDIEHQARLDAGHSDDPLAVTIFNALDWLGQPRSQDLVVTVRSAIPLARGMGSGAAIATALVRALAGYFGRPAPPAEVSALVYQTEVLFHGTPSGIDNTVVAYEQPILFVRGAPPVPLGVGGVFYFVIADTGIASPTKIAVGDVRRAWQAAPATYEALFDHLGGLVEAAWEAIAAGDAARLGPLMTQAQAGLVELGVSSPELDHLTQAARTAGALGAKLSGGGRGGIALALVEPDQVVAVAQALLAAGARQTLTAALLPDGGRRTEDGQVDPRIDTNASAPRADS
ncbi:MAG: mevalonate kinase [Anaerolineae bacterium]|nr:mevalonate kinase [Anaerolineae bacterium]